MTWTIRYNEEAQQDLVFYVPTEEQETVAIIRIMYSGRNITKYLS